MSTASVRVFGDSAAATVWLSLRRSGRKTTGIVAGYPSAPPTAPGSAPGPLSAHTTGWVVALVGVFALLGLVPARGDAGSAGAQIGLAVAAGVLLGAAARASWSRRWAVAAASGVLAERARRTR